MSVIQKIKVYDLAESIYASGYPMLSKYPSDDVYYEEVKKIERDIESENLDNPHIKRAIKLANLKGGGHSQYLTGVVVAFDLTFTNKAWVEAERYKFLNFVSSFSTMHRISKLDISDMCHSKVDERIINILQEKIEKYNQNPNIDNYRAILYNIPSGLKITARMTTNYRCLRNIYEQRKNHRLEEWQDFCRELEKLPLAKELIVN